VLVAGLGTGGTLMGAGERLRESFPDVVVAAAGPRVGGDMVEVKQEGIAIVVTIDISSSMLAEDFAPSNRLEVAKRQAVGFIRGRTADRIGLVAFAGEALTQVPVTLDYPVIEQAVMDLKIGSLEDGTAIGSGLATAVNRLRRAPDKSKVILLLTDGENNKGLIDPRTAAATAAAFGIKVYTIGVGTIGEAPIPTGRGLGGFRYELLPVRIDEPLLQEIAQKTGVKFTYIPFKGGGAVATQLVGGHVDSTVNNPIEAVAQWRAGSLRPLCVFEQKRMPYKEKVTDKMSWADIPTCKEAGLDVDYPCCAASSCPRA
jgi:Ca-activated chloride channel homolog